MTRPNTEWCSRMACSYLNRRWSVVLKTGKVRRQSICSLTGKLPGNMCHCPMDEEEEMKRRSE